ncbi:MAG: NUDIX hydrolase [Xanthomonadales bacterium]|nr:NUDIX hydrolase [Xanthomonadales bacterium]
MLDRASSRSLLQAVKTADSLESVDIKKAICLLDEQADFWQANNGRSHLTASCWVLSPSLDAILLLHHRKLDRWLQPGGHIETDDNSWLEAALREAREETGIDDFQQLVPGIFDFDIHTIPARGKISQHQHYDARFLLQAEQSEIRFSDESNDLQWFSPDKAASLIGGDPVMDRMLAKTRRFMQSRKR